MYKVIVDFADLQDKEHVYRAGDEFPRFGFPVSEERLKELASFANKRGCPLIEKVEEETPQEEPQEELQEEPVKKTKRRVKKTEE